MFTSRAAPCVVSLVFARTEEEEARNCNSLGSVIASIPRREAERRVVNEPSASLARDVGVVGVNSPSGKTSLVEGFSVVVM